MAAEARARHKEATAKGLAAASQLVELQDVTRLSTAQLMAQVAGGALATPSKGAAQPAASVQQLLERFERWEAVWLLMKLYSCSPCESQAIVYLRPAADMIPFLGHQQPQPLPPPPSPARCDHELGKLQQQVDLRAERLRREVGSQEAGHAAQLAALEAQWSGVRQGFGELEGRMTGVTQAATKVGNRLQVRCRHDHG